MKRIIVTVSSLMIVMLFIGTYMYEKQAPVYLPQITEQTDMFEADDAPEILSPVTNNMISYTLQEEELNITYNAGSDWKKVPIAKDLLFQGEYQGNKAALITNSYVLTEDMAAFIYAEETNQAFVDRVQLIYSVDQGETWQESVINDALAAVRFRKIDFLNDSFGYVILSGGRTMSHELSIAYLTYDGGKTWETKTESPTNRLIAFGSFIDEETGFLSYGTIDPDAPDVYVTQDAGETWDQAHFDIPVKYERIFVQAEDPVKKENVITVFVNQGPNGDYAGGKVKAEFISEDNGLTWQFNREVKPDEAE